MAAKLSTPLEAATATIKTTVDGAGWALRSAAELRQRIRPDYVKPEVLARQAILRQYERRFGVDSRLLEPVSSNTELQASVASTADSMLETGFVDQSTVVELRPVLPAEALRDPVLTTRSDEVLTMLSRALGARGIEAIFESHPILPAEHKDSLVEPATIWGKVAVELDGFQHQMHAHPVDRLAMLAITEPEYVQDYFGPQIVSGSKGPVEDRFLVLERVGTLPQANLLGRRIEER